MYAERDGIVHKAVKALQTVIANGYRFSEPGSVSAARKKYQMENDTVISFLNNVCADVKTERSLIPVLRERSIKCIRNGAGITTTVLPRPMRSSVQIKNLLRNYS